MGSMRKFGTQNLQHTARGIAACAFALVVMSAPAHAAAKTAPHANNNARVSFSYEAPAQKARAAVKPLQFAQAETRRISASQAKAVALRHVRGASFVNVQLVNSTTYRVRVQEKNGKIIDVYVDARTGRVKN